MNPIVQHPTKIADRINREALTCLLRDGSIRVGIGTVSFSSGTITGAMAYQSHNNPMLFATAALIGIGVGTASRGFRMLINANKLNKEIREKPPTEVFRDLRRYL